MEDERDWTGHLRNGKLNSVSAEQFVITLGLAIEPETGHRGLLVKMADPITILRVSDIITDLNPPSRGPESMNR